MSLRYLKANPLEAVFLAGLAALGIILITLSCGCTPKQAEAIVKYAEAGGRYMALTEPTLRGAHDLELNECHRKPSAEADILCQEKVNARWAPILEAMGDVHEAFCAIDAERCKP